MGHEAWGKSSILRPQALTNFTKMAKIKTALISVYDKKGIVDFCSILHKKRISIISSGGTAKVLKEAGIRSFQVFLQTLQVMLCSQENFGTQLVLLLAFLGTYQKGIE